MKRREFIGLVGGAMVAWPFPARAQQADRMRRIGVLMGLAAGDPGGQFEVGALKRGLQALGWIEGRNLQIELGWAGGDIEAIEASAKELVALQCEVIVGRSTPVVAALLKETRTIPVVFVVVVDPVGSGFTKSLARPGGNVTGFHRPYLPSPTRSSNERRVLLRCAGSQLTLSANWPATLGQVRSWGRSGGKVSVLSSPVPRQNLTPKRLSLMRADRNAAKLCDLR
jgi:hypothetical protein